MKKRAEIWMLLLTPQGSGAHDTHVYSMGRALAAKGAPATVLPHAHDSRTSLTHTRTRARAHTTCATEHTAQTPPPTDVALPGSPRPKADSAGRLYPCAVCGVRRAKAYSYHGACLFKRTWAPPRRDAPAPRRPSVAPSSRVASSIGSDPTRLCRPRQETSSSSSCRSC